MKQSPLPLLGIADGLCQCGCGRPTTRAPQKQKGYAKGDYQRFIQGHASNRKPKAVRLKDGVCRHGHKLTVVGVTPAGDCRACRRDRSQRAALKNPAAQYQRGRRRQLLARGFTPDDYQALMAQQGGRCAVCREFPPLYKPSLHIDHDHHTQQVRGLLCANCNLMLGHAKDSPAVLRSAADYIERARQAAPSVALVKKAQI